MDKSALAGGALYADLNSEEHHAGVSFQPAPSPGKQTRPGPARGAGFLQKSATRIRTIIEARHTSGAAVAARWYTERLLQSAHLSPNSSWTVRPRQLSHSLNVRRGATSDLRVFEQVLVLDEYACLRGLADVRFIMDLGANVGFSSACLLSAFPSARLIAVEPFGPNLKILRSNLSGYGERAVVVPGAVWSHNTSLRLTDPNASDWAIRVEESTGDGEVQAFDIPTLMKKGGADFIDLLKIDIEGAEANLFSPSSRGWIGRVRNICIELHGPECESAFFEALSGFRYDLSWSGELTVCRNLRPR